MVRRQPQHYLQDPNDTVADPEDDDGWNPAAYPPLRQVDPQDAQSWGLDAGATYPEAPPPAAVAGPPAGTAPYLDIPNPENYYGPELPEQPAPAPDAALAVAAPPPGGQNSLGGRVIQSPLPSPITLSAAPPAGGQNILGGRTIPRMSDLDQIRAKDDAISARTPSPGAVSDDALYKQRQADLVTAYEHRPEMGKPKWWQRAGAMGFAGLAGYVNAEGRIKTPIDIDAATEGILHPGYQGDLQRWTANVAKQRDLVKIEGDKLAEQQKAARNAADVNHLNAEAENARGRGYIAVSKELAAATNNAFHEGQMIPGPLAAQIWNDYKGRYAAKGQVRMTRIDDPEAAAFLGKKVGETASDAEYQLWLKHKDLTPKNTTVAPGAAIVDKDGHVVYANPNRPGRPVDPDIAFDRLDRRQLRHDQDVTAVNEKKRSTETNLDLRQAAELQALQFKYTTPNRNPTDAEKTANAAKIAADSVEIRKRFARLKQDANDEYAAAIRTRGGTADDYDVDPVTGAYTLRGGPKPTPPTPQAGPGRGAGGASGASGGGRGGPPPPAQQQAPPQQQPASAAEAEILVTLPGGRKKVFPNQKALDAYAAASGLTFTPGKK